jgi:ribosome biogenesis protein SSF1/2
MTNAFNTTFQVLIVCETILVTFYESDPMIDHRSMKQRKYKKKERNPQKAVRRPTALPDSAMTMVVHLGDVGSSLKELCSDLKAMLSPFTFPKLKVLKKNKLSDFTAAATPLGAKMLLLLRSRLGKTTLALTRFPRGPTLYFDIVRYASVSDVRGAVEDAVVVNKRLRREPFLVLEGFSTSNEDDVTVSMLQGLFPEIDLGQCDVSIMKRVVIASKADDGVVSIRHYKIHTRDLQVNAVIQAIANGIIPDLSDYETIDDFVLQGIHSQKKAKPRQAIHLQEIGPRIDMTFNHVETGVFGGMKLTEVDDKPRPPKQFNYRSPKPKPE